MTSNEIVHSDRKAVPILKTGRRSKDLVLFGEEAARREKRRKRNREAARRLKEKRQSIEEELSRKLQDLETQHSDLKKYIRFLQRRKKLLEDTINDRVINPIDQYLSTRNYSIDPFDESIESILKSIFI